MKKLHYLFLVLLGVLILSCEVTVTPTFNVNFMVDNKIISSVNVKSGATVQKPDDPVKDGYKFLYWMLENEKFDFNTPIESETTLIAKFEKLQSDTAKYTLKHFKKNIEDDKYTLNYSTELSGKIGEKTPDDNTEYEGFFIKEQKPSIINADNSSVHEVYYDRNIITYTFNTDGGSSIESVSGKYGAKVPTIQTPTKNRYIFEEWTPKIPETFTESLIFTAKWTLDTNILYTVKHWILNINDNEYTLKDTEINYGLVNEYTKASTKEYTGFTAKTFDQKIIAEDGSTVIDIYYDRNIITFTFDTDGGSSIEPISGRYGAQVPEIPSPTKEDYSFTKWNPDIPLIFQENIQFKAIWTFVENPIYKVEHYQQNIENDDYTLVPNSTETLSGKTGTLTSATAKNYEGFTAKSFDQKSISADSSTVVKIYYDRNIITYTFNTDGGPSITPISGKYGAQVPSVQTPEKSGYTFEKWTPDLPSTFTASTTFTASWTKIIYKVEHYQQNIQNDDYILYDTETIDGIAGEQTEATSNNYTGFNVRSFTQKTISADNSTVVKIYYDRKIITFTFDTKKGGTKIEPVTGKYGAQVPTITNPTRNGFTFNYWSQPIPKTFQEDMTFSAVWVTIFGITYKIEHYQQNINDNDYTLVTEDTETFQSDEDAQTEATAKNYTGFTVLPFSQTTVEYDNSTVVKIYYNRNIYKLSFNTDGGTDLEPVSYKYGKTITVPTITKKGYVFNSWSEEIPQTMPAHDIQVTASWLPATNTPYRVRHYKQTLDGTDYVLAATDPSYTGTTGLKTLAQAESYTGFTAKSFEQVEIAADGSTVVDIYYDRILYTITFDLDGGTVFIQGLSEDNTITGLYGASLPIIYTPTKDNCAFNGWSTSIPNTFTQDLTITAKWKAVTSISVTFGNSDISIKEDTSNGIITLTADAGYDDYQWFIDGEAPNDSNIIANDNILTLQNLAPGVYDVYLYVRHNLYSSEPTMYYSAFAQIEIQ